MDTKENLKNIIDEMGYGQVAKIDMLERGAYADSSLHEKRTAALFSGFASDYLLDQGDLTIVSRNDLEVALNQADFEQYIENFTASKHIIFVECLELSTTEIKGFLNALIFANVLEKSKVVLLDLPLLEYMALRSSLKEKITI